MKFLKLSVFALMFILAWFVWGYAQVFQGAVAILNSVQSTVAMEKAVQDLTREGRYHERCPTDLGSVILLECGPITGLPQEHKMPHFPAQDAPRQHNSGSVDTGAIAYYGGLQEPSVSHVEPQVTVSLRNLGEGPHVKDMVMPVYPQSNLNQLIEGLVVARVRVRQGSIDSIQIILPKKEQVHIPPYVSGPISGRIPGRIPIPSIPHMSRINKEFVESVTLALNAWEFRLGESSNFEVTVKFSLKK